MTQIKKLERKALSWFLALAMVLSTFAGIVPGMSLTAKAAPAETLLTTITPTGTTTYSESTAGVVNVTLSNISRYGDGQWKYGGTVTVTQKEGYTITKCRFNARTGPVDDTEAPFSIDVNQAVYVGTVEVYGYATGTGPDKSALNDAITAAETLYNSIKDNTDYADIANTFQTAINTAKGVADSDEVDQDAVDAATTTITTAKTTAVVGMINKLPVASDVTTSDKTTIEAVRAAFDSLSDEEQAKVDPDTLKKLTDAEVALAVEDATELEAATTNWTNGSWYIVPEGGLTISSRVTVNGTVNLILRDGAKLTVNGGIGLNDGNTLNIYPETKNGTGELNANASTKYDAGIGGTYNRQYSVACGTLTIHGGVIKAKGAENGPGIGNSGQGFVNVTQAAGTVIIYAGNVTATGGNYGSAGIGGGWGYVGGCNVEIYGGTVLANVGSSPNGAQGIGYAGGDATKYPGTLTLGKGVKLYSGTNNSGTVLDENDSENRTYNGNRSQNMFAEYHPTGPDKSALNDAITAAETLYNSIKDNTDYAGIANTFQTAINTAKGVADSDEVDQDAVDTATSDIITANTTAIIGIINALPATGDVTTADKGIIEAVRAAFDSLSDEEQAKVDPDTLKKLTDAEAALAVEEVKEAINTLPAANTVTSSNEEDIVAARTAYGNLTDAQKTEVGADALAKLEACEVALAIAKLPEATSVTTENKDAIEAARTAYNALTDEQKTTVGNDALEKLEACEVALAIAELPEADSVTTDNKDAIEAARTAYEALTDDQKTAVGTDANAKLEAVEVALVNKTIEALPEAKDVTIEDKEAIEAARAAYEALTPEQQESVNKDPSILAYLQTAEVALAIAELPAASEVTAKDKKDIKAARAAYEALTPEQKATISEDSLKKLKDAEDKLLIIETVSELVSDEAKASEVTDKINYSLPAADEITLKDEIKVAAARMAYELLTDAQKNLVPEETLNKLEAAEKKISDLKEQAALDAVKDSAIERLDVYAEARAKSDATADEKAAFDKAVADGKDAINDATSQEAVATALTDAKALVNEAIAKIEKDRADAAEAAAEMAAADKAVADADKAAEDAAAAADKAAADQYASDADKKAINDAKAEVEKAVKDAKDLPANATAKQKSDAAKDIEDAVKVLSAAVDTANVNSAAAKAEAEEAADKAAQLKVAKDSAVERLEIYAEARAKSDATTDEKTAYDKAVADGKKAINEAADKDKVAEALTNAKAAVDAALAKIEKDRADAAAAAAEMAEADKAVADAHKAAEDAVAAADKAAADQYASNADKETISGAKAEVEKTVKDAKDLPANATAKQKSDAAKAIEDVVKVLSAAVDTANVNSAAAKADAEEQANTAAQLAAAKTTAIGRLEDFSEAKALSKMTKAEKAAYDKVVDEGKAAINAAEDADAVNAALKKAKADVNKAIAKTKNDRSAAKAKVKAVKTVTVNPKTVNAKAIDKAVKKAGGSNKYVTSIVLGKKVKKISKAAFKTYKKVKTLTVKTKKLKKKAVKNSLKGSKVTKIKVKVGTKKVNKKYVKKYKKIFKKKNSGKKVKVTL